MTVCFVLSNVFECYVYNIKCVWRRRQTNSHLKIVFCLLSVSTISTEKIIIYYVIKRTNWKFRERKIDSERCIVKYVYFHWNQDLQRRAFTSSFPTCPVEGHLSCFGKRLLPITCNILMYIFMWDQWQKNVFINF